MTGKKHKDYSKPIIPGVLTLNAAARSEVKAVWMALGKDATYTDVAKVTGYSTNAIMDYMLRQSARKYKPSANACKGGKKKQKNPAKPQFIREVEQATGLQCQFYQKTENDTEWLLMSPTKVALIKLFGSSDVIVGAQVANRVALQGLTKLEQESRRAKKSLKSEPLPPELPEIESADELELD